jgi:hypothetical protein
VAWSHHYTITAPSNATHHAILLWHFDGTIIYGILMVPSSYGILISYFSDGATPRLLGAMAFKRDQNKPALVPCFGGRMFGRLRCWVRIQPTLEDAMSDDIRQRLRAHGHEQITEIGAEAPA